MNVKDEYKNIIEAVKNKEGWNCETDKDGDLQIYCYTPAKNVFFNFFVNSEKRFLDYKLDVNTHIYETMKCSTVASDIPLLVDDARWIDKGIREMQNDVKRRIKEDIIKERLNDTSEDKVKEIARKTIIMDKKEELKNIIEAVDNQGWGYEFDKDGDLEIFAFTPAGDCFNFFVNSEDGFLNFKLDIDTHVKERMTVPDNVPGVVELVDDARWINSEIKSMQEYAGKLKKIENQKDIKKEPDERQCR